MGRRIKIRVRETKRNQVRQNMTVLILTVFQFMYTIYIHFFFSLPICISSNNLFYFILYNLLQFAELRP